MTRVKAKPIGIMPERIWRIKIIRERIQDLWSAIIRREASCLPVSPAWQSELYRHNDELLLLSLSEVKTEQDFETILNGEFRNFMGSRRRCAEELKKLAPPKKQGIITRAIRRLSRDRDWNFAGD